MIEEVEELTPESFRFCPIWSWSDNKEKHLPFLGEQKISKEGETLFIKADLITGNGVNFEGYIVGRGSFHALFVLHNNNYCPISLTSPQARELGLNMLWKSLGRKIDNFFPIGYSTGLLYDTGEKIAGKLSPN